MKSFIIIAALLAGIAAPSLANAGYRSCTTTCYGNVCTTTCY